MATSTVEPNVQLQLQANGKTEPLIRHVENHLPCIWGDQFTDFTLQDSVLEAYTKETEGLKQQVRAMLMENGPATASATATATADEKIYFIDSLHRLGVSYHFDKEIKRLLENMFINLNIQDHDYDLYTTSLHFRVFREHGFKMSCDVFNKFKESSTGSGSSFKESLATDIKGMLSLYEASYLRLRGEDVLDEALAFTTSHLKGAVGTSQISPPLLEKQVTHALWQPLYQGIPRIETRFHISVYEEEIEEDHESSRNVQLLLKFAKLDFNLLQLLYKQELSLLFKWFKSMEFLLTFPYNKHVRRRLVECYFFSIALLFEPCYSLGRMMLTKYATLIVMTDDIYDGYGTIEELKLFTDAIDKWEVKCMNELPDYMKPLYNAYLETYNEFNNELIKDGRSYSVYYDKQAIKNLVKAYIREATWFKDGSIPAFEEYMEVAKISCTAESLITTTFMGMDEATKKVFEWLERKPKILEGLEVIGRLHDDIVGTELEPKATAVHSYIKQYGVGEKEAIDGLWEMVANAWKDMNEEWLTPTSAGVPLNLLLRLFNLARFMNATYKVDDGFDHPKLYISFINILLVDPIPVV